MSPSLCVSHTYVPPPQPTSAWSAHVKFRATCGPLGRTSGGGTYGYASAFGLYLLPWPRPYAVVLDLLRSAHGYTAAVGLFFLHRPRLSSRRTILAVDSQIASPLPKTGPDGAHGYASIVIGPSASSSSQVNPHCWREHATLPASAVTVGAF